MLQKSDSQIESLCLSWSGYLSLSKVAALRIGIAMCFVLWNKN